jgi:hypothetical protein
VQTDSGPGLSDFRHPSPPMQRLSELDCAMHLAILNPGVRLWK